MNNTLAFALLVCVSAAACGGEPKASTTQFEVRDGHRYFPLEPGTEFVYRGKHGDRQWDETATVGYDVRSISGIECRPVVELVYHDGELAERTTEWFATDARGNVWKYGEEAFEVQGGELVRSADSWLADESTVEPWIALPVRLLPGDTFLGNRTGGTDSYQVVSIDAVAIVPAGPFAGCLTLLENPDDPEDTDIILYAPGVGRVSERTSTGYVDLVSVRRR
jgi:hypothetical protein